jgi:hypothetical protein
MMENEKNIISEWQHFGPFDWILCHLQCDMPPVPDVQSCIQIIWKKNIYFRINEICRWTVVVHLHLIDIEGDS